VFVRWENTEVRKKFWLADVKGATWNTYASVRGKYYYGPFQEIFCGNVVWINLC